MSETPLTQAAQGVRVDLTNLHIMSNQYLPPGTIVASPDVFEAFKAAFPAAEAPEVAR